MGKRKAKNIDSDDEPILDVADLEEYVIDDEDDDESLPSRYRKSSAKEKEGAIESSGALDFSHLKLHPDHKERPLWVTPNRRIFVESFSPQYSAAHDLLIAIAEPVGRPSFVHEYLVTTSSLYSAVSVGLHTEDIINALHRLSKCQVPESVIEHIRQCTSSYGQAKLVLLQSRFFIEAASSQALAKLLGDSVIKEARIRRSRPAPVPSAPSDAPSTADDPTAAAPMDVVDADDVTDEVTSSRTFEIAASQVTAVKRRCVEMDLPLLEEYDYRNDINNPTLAIERRPSAMLRPYQAKALAKMFGSGRARSGIIVLPCGAGKTLVGVSAACTVKKSILVLATGAMSVEQWREQFLLWADVPDSSVTRFTADAKEMPAPDAGVVVTTYTMIAHSGTRAAESARIMDMIQKREWGLLILDEVHVVPADVFRRVVSVTTSHCKLGLTATLVREDEKISHLNFLIGPKLYEANWMELTKGGFIANVQCVEVWCRMTAEFFAEYMPANPNKRMLLFAMNPNKFRTCQYLINYHEARGDKVIVFSDNIFALETFAKRLNKPYIYGKTHQQERMRILHQFTSNPRVNTIFLSKVGDNSIDLPDANVLIQISSHYGSRRQEAQRLGRILRPKPGGTSGEFNAFFYSLVSTDTQEMYYSSKRQQFLVDQGYAFKVVTDLVDPADSSLAFSTKKERMELLTQVLMADESMADDENLTGGDLIGDGSRIAMSGKPGVRRHAGSTNALSGSSGLYMEMSSGQKPSIFSRPVVRHALFKKRFK